MIISARIKNEKEYEYLRKKGVNISRLVDKAIMQCSQRCIYDDKFNVQTLKFLEL